MALWGCLLLVAATGAQALGYVHDLTGSVNVRRGALAPQPLRIGDLVDEGHIVATEANSTAIIKFEDGQVMALHERSSFVVRQYLYNKQQVSASRATFELLRGGLRFITGVIGSTNRNAMRYTAGNATIGIRGTDNTLHYDPATRDVTAVVHQGAISMATSLGTQIIEAGSFSTATPTAPPAPPAPQAQAAPAVQQAVTALLQRPVPVNTPVVVQASARAVAAAARARTLRQQAAQQPANTALQQSAQQAEQQAQQALAEAVTSAQAAYQAAIQGGAVAPAPPAPSPAPTSPGTVTTPPAEAAPPVVPPPAPPPGGTPSTPASPN